MCDIIFVILDCAIVVCGSKCCSDVENVLCVEADVVEMLKVCCLRKQMLLKC